MAQDYTVATSGDGTRTRGNFLVVGPAGERIAAFALEEDAQLFRQLMACDTCREAATNRMREHEEREERERKANQPVNAGSSDDDIRDRARELHQVDGECEIDEDALVSQNVETTSEGAYVQAWVWVPFEEVE